MKLMLVAMFLLLLLLVAAILPVMTAYRAPRKKLNGAELCALDRLNETIASSSEQQCSLTCKRDDICSGYNIKNSLIHAYSPVITSIHLC